MNRIRSRLRSMRSRVWRRIEQSLTEVRLLRNLPVHVFDTRVGEWDDDLLFEKVDAALELIALYRPIWLRRMERDISRISVRNFPVCRAAFSHHPRTLILDSYFVATFSVKDIASSIVHEAAHARIRSRLPELAPELRGREERMCRRAQLRFILTLPDGDGQAVWLKAAIQATDEELAPDVDWNEPYRRALLATLEQVDRPAWLKRWLTRKVEQHFPLRAAAPEGKTPAAE